MNIAEVIKKRQAEIEWLNINGLDNADFYTNGEFKILDSVKNYYNLLVDIGANCGDFVQEVRNHNPNSKVIAFEPNPNALKELEKINDIGIHKVAISDKCGEMQFNIHATDTTVGSLVDRIEMMPSFTNKMNKINVKVQTLDNYIEEVKQKAGNEGIYIKIDTEGSELAVLKGAKKILTLDNPIFIHFEYLPLGWKETNSSLKEMFHLFEESGFNVYRITPLGLEQIRFYTIDLQNYHFCNYIAIKNIEIKNILNKVHKIPSLQTITTTFYEF